MLLYIVTQVLHCDVVPRISFHGTKEVIKANTTFVRLVATNIKLTPVLHQCCFIMAIRFSYNHFLHSVE